MQSPESFRQTATSPPSKASPLDGSALREFRGADSQARLQSLSPVYGCGGFESLKLVPDTISMKNLKKWVSLWDPNNYLGNAKLPILWINGTADAAFDIFNWNKSTKLSPKQTYRALRINMPHSQNEGMNAPEILPFAKSVVSGAEFPGFTKIKLDDEGERLR